MRGLINSLGPIVGISVMLSYGNYMEGLILGVIH